MSVSSYRVRGGSGIDCSDFVDLLDQKYWDIVFDSRKRLRVKSLRLLLAHGHHINVAFYNKINELRPNYNLPPLAPAFPEPSLDPNQVREVLAAHSAVQLNPQRQASPVLQSVNDEGLSESDDDLHPEVTSTPAARMVNTPPRDTTDDSGGASGQFTWATKALWDHTASTDPREADGSLKKLDSIPNEIVDGQIRYTPTGVIPDSVATEDFKKVWNHIQKVNGKQIYDAEEVALGSISESHYMILPSDFDIPICDIDKWGTGFAGFPVNMLVVIAVYALARYQAKDLNMDETRAIKWAILRMEAFKAGWFNFQKHCKYKKTPIDFCIVFAKDHKEIQEHADRAYHVAGFIPFLAEFHFRCYGSSYSKANGAEYEARAQKLANSAIMAELVDYMDKDILFGPALNWIGVKRPMQVLTDDANIDRVPSVFLIRRQSGAAGSSTVTTAAQAIAHLKTNNWWETIKQAGGYDETDLVACAEKILENPWKYHQMSRVYGVPALSPEEKATVTKAKKDAELYAPVLQGYIDTTAKKTDLGNAQVLKKAAKQNMAVYTRAMNAFRTAGKQKVLHGKDIFSNEMFADKKRKRRAAGNDGAGTAAAGGDEETDETDEEEESAT